MTSPLSSSLSKVAVIVGAGPGIGASVAKRFALGGYHVAIIARKSTTLEPIHKDIESSGGKVLSITADAAESKEISTAFSTIRSKLGHPEVLVYNCGAFAPGGILDIKPDLLSKIFNVSVLGALTSSQEVLPAMVENKKGTIIFTGATASLRGSKGFASLAIPKFGLRALSQSMCREFQPFGIHVCHTIIDGQVLTSPDLPKKWNRDENTFISPTAVAETYWQLHQQDKAAFSQEIDLRCHLEKF